MIRSARCGEAFLNISIPPLVLLAMVAAGCSTATGPTPASAPAAPARAAQTEKSLPKGTLDPREAQARVHLEVGRAAIARGDMAAATIPLREALRWEPELVEARESLARALYGMGDLDAALDELRGLLRQRPDAVQARLTLATVLMARQDWSSARTELEVVLRQQPDLVQAHYNLGAVLYAMRDLNGAIHAYRRGLTHSPNHPDVRYNLALLLTVAHRGAEATPEFLVAAQAGHARAQYFAGMAYARGFGVDRDLSLAITWWSRAAERDVGEAQTVLRDLRQTALGRSGRTPTERQAAEQAFRDHRLALWSEFPELARAGADDTVGAALLRQGRGREAVRMLIREASAFSEPAQGLLESLYDHGVQGQLPAHDPRILEYFKTAADEGQVRPRITLARFYAAGLGVPKDMARAIDLLKATPHEDAQRLLQELSAAGEAVPVPTRP